MKWYGYVICLVLIVVGAFSGIQLYRELKAESYVNGSIDITNKFSQESFNYSATSLVFYHDLYDDTDTYSFEKDLTKIDDFNGQIKKYEVTLNKYYLTNAEIKAGSIYATTTIDFYNTDGEQIEEAEMQLSILFLSDKTKLTITTKGKQSASFLEQYFKDNGIRLCVNEILREVK